MVSLGNLYRKWIEIGAAVIGLTIGILTVFGQQVLPGQWNSLANSVSVWLTPAFFAAAPGSSKTRAAMAGIFALLGMVAGYYVYAMFVQGVAHSAYYMLVWSGAAVAGGIVFGIAGCLWKNGGGRSRACGSAIIGGAFVAEGLHLFMNFADYSHMTDVGTAQVAIGFVLALGLERSLKARGAALIAMLPVVSLGLIGYQILDSLTG